MLVYINEDQKQNTTKIIIYCVNGTHYCNCISSTLPLYGKEVRGRRDQYHYYTTTPGDQVYPLPVTIDNRDCMDDIGCRELYGNEDVSVLGQTGSFQAKMYRTDNFF